MAAWSSSWVEPEVQHLMSTAAVQHDALQRLHAIRSRQGKSGTPGLDDATIVRFVDRDARLLQAIGEAEQRLDALVDELGENVVFGDEGDLVRDLQSGFVNFYAAPTVNPYVALAARGPWIVTAHGAVLHDNGGYGMLGAGHGPQDVIDAMAGNHVMANVMTPSFSSIDSSNACAERLGTAGKTAAPSTASFA